MEALRIIKDEHRNLWRVTITLEQVVAEMERENRVDEAFLKSVFDYFEQFVDRMHHPKETDYLFRLLRERKPDARIVVGGAVLTQEYADSIGADCYARDAMATVHYADHIFES